MKLVIHNLLCVRWLWPVWATGLNWDTHTHTHTQRHYATCGSILRFSTAPHATAIRASVRRFIPLLTDAMYISQMQFYAIRSPTKDGITHGSKYIYYFPVPIGRGYWAMLLSIRPSVCPSVPCRLIAKNDANARYRCNSRAFGALCFCYTPPRSRESPLLSAVSPQQRHTAILSSAAMTTLLLRLQPLRTKFAFLCAL